MERVLGLRMADRPASVGSFAANLRAFESVRDFVASATITISSIYHSFWYFLAIARYRPWDSASAILYSCVGSRVFDEFNKDKELVEVRNAHRHCNATWWKSGR